MILKPRGTNDILPSESHKWHIVETIIKNVLKKYNFQELRTPIFENYQLFDKSMGSETDIVSKEMYVFKDKKNRLMALRPEGTASAIRAMVEAKQLKQKLPKKIYYYGPMFRYERPQKGRYRQFYQLGIEAIGSKNPLLDFEVISLAYSILKELGITNFKFKINNLGHLNTRKRYTEHLTNYFQNYNEELSEISQKRIKTNPLRIIDDKNERNKDFVKNSPTIQAFLTTEEKEYFNKIINALLIAKIPFEIDNSIVRGLDYYDGVVFEVVSLNSDSGSQSTIFGGGRYNGLVEKIGGIDVSGTGFAIGFERLLIQVEKDNPELLKKPGIQVFVSFENPETEKAAHLLLQQLRNKNISCDTSFINHGISKQSKMPTWHDAKISIIIGKKELETKTLFIKDLKNNKRYNIRNDEISKIIKLVRD